MRILYILLFISILLFASGYDSLTAKSNKTGTKLFTAYKQTPVSPDMWYYNRR